MSRTIRPREEPKKPRVDFMAEDLRPVRVYLAANSVSARRPLRDALTRAAWRRKVIARSLGRWLSFGAFFAAVALRSFKADRRNSKHPQCGVSAGSQNRIKQPGQGGAAKDPAIELVKHTRARRHQRNSIHSIAPAINLTLEDHDHALVQIVSKRSALVRHRTVFASVDQLNDRTRIAQVRKPDIVPAKWTVAIVDHIGALGVKHRRQSRKPELRSSSYVLDAALRRDKVA